MILLREKTINPSSQTCRDINLSSSSSVLVLIFLADVGCHGQFLQSEPGCWLNKRDMGQHNRAMSGSCFLVPDW